MFKKIRTALIWLLLLAIPTQGIAAATMLYCGPNHPARTLENVAAPSVAIAAILPVHSVPHSQTGHSEHGMHDHAAPVAHHDESNATDQSSPADLLEQSPNTKCSVCALCCNAAGVASSPLLIPTLGVFSAPIVTVSESPISFVTDGPRRPPRSFLA